MPHNITEVDAFTTPVTVPDGTDDHMLLSSYILSFVQALADRTHALNLHRAFVDASNTFTATQTFNLLVTLLTQLEVDNNDASIAALVTRPTANDDAHAGNKYKAVLGFQIGDSRGYVNIYAGNGSSEAQYIITLNAVWDTTAQNWHADNTGQPSVALLFKPSSGVQVSQRNAGSGTWTTWPQTSGDVAVGGDYKYAATRTRTTLIPLTRAVGNTFFDTRAEGGIVLNPADICLLKLDLPNGAVVHSVECMIHPGGASAVTLKAHKRINHTWGGSPVAPTGSTIATSTTTGTGLQVISVDFGGLTVDSSDQEYWISVDGGNTGDVVWAARIVSWTDPGPVNN